MQLIHWPLQRGNSLLFLNGQYHPLSIELVNSLITYQGVFACDGAWNHFNKHENKKIANYISAVMGDGDSIVDYPVSFVELADQSATDFEKTLKQLIEQEVLSVDVYWASGGEMDHFLGNLSVAAKYHHQILIRFYDDKQCYFYVDQDCRIKNAQSRLLTIYPFPMATVSSHGLGYEIQDYEIHVAGQQSLRNIVIADEVNLTISGGVFLFITR